MTMDGLGDDLGIAFPPDYNYCCNTILLVLYFRSVAGLDVPPRPLGPRRVGHHPHSKAEHAHMAQSITVNGNTYNDSPYDASTNPGGLANGGWRVDSKFITMLLDTLVDSSSSLQDTSTTSLTIGTGTKVLSLANNRPIPVGLYVFAIENGGGGLMFGQVTDHTTNQLTVNVTYTEGAGTIADWVIQPTGPRGLPGLDGADGADGASALTFAGIKTTAYTLANREWIVADTSGGSFAVTVPNTSPTAGDEWAVQKIGDNQLDIARNTLPLNGQTDDAFIPAATKGRVHGAYVDGTAGYELSWAPRAS